MDGRLHYVTFGRHLWGVPSPPRGTLEVSAELRVFRPSLGLGEVLDPLALLISTKHKGACPATHRHPAWVWASLGTCLAAHAASNGTQASFTYGPITSIASPRHVCMKSSDLLPPGWLMWWHCRALDGPAQVRFRSLTGMSSRHKPLAQRMECSLPFVAHIGHVPGSFTPGGY